MYSIYHGQTVAEDKRVIDSNDRIMAHIQAYEEKVRQQRLESRRQMAQDFFESIQLDEEGNPLLELD
ncbi:MAG: hypothetical protein IIT72_01275, partial [Lachnospiraceae bacterium]|nr:hypothetical protein [Lachnospiraceae bacterium]